MESCIVAGNGDCLERPNSSALSSLRPHSHCGEGSSGKDIATVQNMCGVPAAPPKNYLTWLFKPSTPQTLDLSLVLSLITSHLIRSRGSSALSRSLAPAQPAFTRMCKVILCLPFLSVCYGSWEGACAGQWQVSGMEA